MFANFFSAYFLLGSLIPGTNFSDLAHIPDLIDHYQLHVEEAEQFCKEYSICQFLNDHFVNPDQHTQTGHEKEHQSLPLHSVSSHLFVACDFNFVNVIFNHPEVDLRFNYILAEALECEKGIFQPPI